MRSRETPPLVLSVSIQAGTENFALLISSTSCDESLLLLLVLLNLQAMLISRKLLVLIVLEHSIKRSQPLPVDCVIDLIFIAQSTPGFSWSTFLFSLTFLIRVVTLFKYDMIWKSFGNRLMLPMLFFIIYPDRGGNCGLLDVSLLLYILFFCYCIWKLLFWMYVLFSLEFG